MMEATDDASPDPWAPDYGAERLPDPEPCIVCVLGPVEATFQGVVASLGPPKQRATFIVLVLNANNVVSTDQLISSLWAERAPRTAAHSIQIYVSELRKAFASFGDALVISTRPSGYRLEVREDAVDAYRFERLVHDGRRAVRAGDVTNGVRMLRAAVGLWRGAPLQEFTYDDFAQRHIRRLGDLHLDLIEELAAAELNAGHGPEALQRIEAVLDEDRLREGFIELRMLAMYRSGRHVYALRAYQAYRELLAEELGVVPSLRLQRLHEKILLHDSSLRPGPASVELLEAAPHNPYKGLRPFREHDAGDFFGRDGLTRRVTALLAGGHRLISLVGPSGAGKSSVVAAGLIPRLRDGAIAGSAEWLIVSVVPGAHPMGDVETAIVRATATGRSADASRSNTGNTGNTDEFLRLLRATSEHRRVLVVLDQFEQLFLTADDSSQRQFLDVLATAVTEPETGLTVVLTLRADHYDRPLLHARFAAAFTPGVINVLPMESTDVEAAVVGPAARVGVDVEPQLIAELVADTADQPGCLPLLQYALTDQFERKTGTSLTLVDYHRLGGLRCAVARRADELYDSLSEHQQHVATQVLLRMVRVDRGDENSIRRVPISEFTNLDLDAVALSAVLDVFGRHRLLSFDRDTSTGNPTVEMAHEALITEWHQLAGWIEHHREALRRIERIRSAAVDWEDSGRHPDYLLSGVRLADVETISTSTVIPVSTGERDFIGAAVAQRQAGQDAETARSGEQHRLERRARRRLIGLGVAVVVLIGVLIVGVAGGGSPRTNRATLFYAAAGEIGELISGSFDRGVSDFGYVSKKVDGDVSNSASKLDSISADGQLVIVFQIATDVTSVAQKHPGTRYVVLDRRVDGRNVTSIEFVDNEGSYLAGAAAALKTRTGTIGFVGGVDTDTIWQFQAGFEAGAKATNPNVRVLTTYLAAPPNFAKGFLDPTAGERAARNLYGAGADIIFAAAGTSGLGVFQAAADLSLPDKRLWAIGVDSDQYVTVAKLPGSVHYQPWRQHILTSMVKRYDNAVHTALDAYAHGKLEPTTETLGLAQDGVDISYSGGYIDDIRTKIDTLRQGIVSGSIHVPCYPPDKPTPSADTSTCAT